MKKVTAQQQIYTNVVR